MTVDDVVNVLSVPGRVAGNTLDNLSSALRPEYSVREENVSSDTFGVVALVMVAGALVAVLLYVWGR